MSDVSPNPTLTLQSLPTDTFQRYQALYRFWSTVSLNLQNQMIARTTGQPVNRYSFNAGDGVQSTDRMTLDELTEAIRNAESLVRLYYQKCNGRGLMNHMIRR